MVNNSRKGSSFGKTCKECELVGMTGELRVCMFFLSCPILVVLLTIGKEGWGGCANVWN